MEKKTKFCKWCGDTIDIDCVVCPKCGKQVEELKGPDRDIIINNTATASAVASNPDKYRKMPWYLTWFWIIVLGALTGGIYWVIGIVMRVVWKSNN